MNKHSSEHTIALIPNDTVGKNMAGPGIRYWEFARTLEQYFSVKLVVPPFVSMAAQAPTPGAPASLHICAHGRDLRALVQDCDVIITRGAVLTAYPFLSELGKPLVLDLYSPTLLEGIQREAEANLLQKLTTYENDLEALRFQLRAGDFFICADERQRDYWLGMLSAVGRVNPYNHQRDPTLRHLIDLVPFGLPQHSPQHTRPVLKGVYQTIAAEDKVVLWGGGVWNWLDAPTVIRAMPLVLNERDDVKLFFLGTKRPNPRLAKMTAVDQAVALSKKLKLYDEFVFFNEWVPYEERQNYLLEADIGVSLHRDHIEARFAFRTRLLDYIWAGLPTVATPGDTLSEILAAENLALLVAPGDAPAVAEAILTMLAQPDLRAERLPRFQELAESYHWKTILHPLIAFCAAPHLAPDKAYLARHPIGTQDSPRHLLTKGWRALRLGGVSGLLRQSVEYLRWRLSK